MLPGLTGFCGFSNIYNTFVTVSTSDAGGTSPHTFSAVNFGPAYTERWLIACTAFHGTAGSAINITSVTIGGISTGGTDSGSFGGAGPSMGAGLFYANVPLGTSGDVVVTWTGQTTNSSALILISTPKLTFFNDWRPPTPNGGWTSLSGTMNIPTNGLVVGVSSHTAGSITWTGVTGRATQALTGGTLEVGFDIHQAAASGAAVEANWSSVGQGGVEFASFSEA